MNKSKYLSIILAILLQIFSFTSFAQVTEPEDPGGGPELGDPPLGGGAPIGGGVIVLLLLGTVYGGKKVFDMTKKEVNDDLV